MSLAAAKHVMNELTYSKMAYQVPLMKKEQGVQIDY
jgi:hypothetical protein